MLGATGPGGLLTSQIARKTTARPSSAWSRTRAGLLRAHLS